MKKFFTIGAALTAGLFSNITFAGGSDVIFKSTFEFNNFVAGTSFEDPVIVQGVNDGKYFDTGNWAFAHDLVNNDGQTPVDLTPAVELDMDARWEPYNSELNNSFIDEFDNPIEGMTEGDFAGATTFTPSGNPFTDGTQGYQLSDADGTMILVSETVDLTGKVNNQMTLDYFIAQTTWEIDEPAAGNDIKNDAIRIYAENMVTNARYYILDTLTDTPLTTIIDIDDLNIEGIWQNADIMLPDDVMVRFVVEFRAGSSAEILWLDNLQFRGL